MVNLNEYVAIEVNGEEVSLYEVLSLAKLNGSLQLISHGIDAALVRQVASQRGIEVSDDELQQAADEFRAENDLYDADTTQSWLESKHLSYQEWESSLEYRVVERKLREALTAGLVDQRFVEQRLSFDKAAVSRLVLSDEGVARELRAQIVEDGADFHALAREHSIHTDTRMAGGYAGEMLRTDMEPALEAAIFGAQAGKVIGPIKTDDGWELVKLEGLVPAELDDEMRETIKTVLFDEWLAEQRRKARIKVPLLDAAEDESNAELDSD
ncbi:MAG TPA: peptidylprolyl isomerase [Pyrinomonadaceae bacterium]|nr:peptidylprolyl isomerase [Pyrinomonadaceae bacterium]